MKTIVHGVLRQSLYAPTIAAFQEKIELQLPALDQEALLFGCPGLSQDTEHAWIIDLSHQWCKDIARLRKTCLSHRTNNNWHPVYLLAFDGEQHALATTLANECLRGGPEKDFVISMQD